MLHYDTKGRFNPRCLLRKNMAHVVWVISLCLLHVCKAKLSMRLVNSQSAYEGRLEVSRDNRQWGTVCMDGWSDINAHIVCKQLFGSSRRYGQALRARFNFGVGSGNIFLDDVQCNGTESSLEQCKHAAWGTHNCVHMEDAAVTCHTQNVRLEGGSTDNGVVHVLDEDKKWAVQCGTGFDDIDAKVVCRQLGFSYGLALPVGSYGAVEIALNQFIKVNISCTGTESSLSECVSSNTGPCNTIPYNYGAVSCWNKKARNTDYAVKLHTVPGRPDNVGAVMVKFKGLWSHVCGSHWDDTDAAVVCREMGFKGGVSFNPVRDSSMPGPYIGGTVTCNGTEDTLIKCPSSAACVHIGPVPVAGVLCHRTSALKLRLIEDSKQIGRLELEMDGEVGGICDNTWNVVDARVACQQLGYADGDNIRGLTAPYTKMFLASVECVTRENSIFECRSTGWKENLPKECVNKNNSFAGVECYTAAFMDIAQESEHAATGNLLTFHNERWYHVCDESFDSATANLACREMGFYKGVALPSNPMAVRNEFRIFFLQLKCSVGASSLKQCQYFETTSCDRQFLPDRYATMMCVKKRNTRPDFKMIPPTGFPYTPMIQMYGLNGTICATGHWTHKGAETYCRDYNYQYGRNETRYSYIGPRTGSVEPFIFMSNISCSRPGITSIKECNATLFKANEIPCLALASVSCAGPIQTINSTVRINRLPAAKLNNQVPQHSQQSPRLQNIANQFPKQSQG